MIYKALLENQSLRIEAQTESPPPIVKDLSYRDYLRSYNGGYYFDNSLHLFGLRATNKWNDFVQMNALISNLYGDLLDISYSFGEDIFGNLFGQSAEGCVMINIESGEIEHLAKNFEQWVTVLLDDVNYLTGHALTEELEVNEIEDLGNGFRLCPKYPFILGGDYLMDNLYLKFFSENLEYNSSIAHQIINTPEGKEVNLKITRSK